MSEYENEFRNYLELTPTQHGNFLDDSSIDKMIYTLLNFRT